MHFSDLAAAYEEEHQSMSRLEDYDDEHTVAALDGYSRTLVQVGACKCCIDKHEQGCGNIFEVEWCRECMPQHKLKADDDEHAVAMLDGYYRTLVQVGACRCCEIEH